MRSGIPIVGGVKDSGRRAIIRCFLNDDGMNDSALSFPCTLTCFVGEEMNNAVGAGFDRHVKEDRLPAANTPLTRHDFIEAVSAMGAERMVSTTESQR